LLPLSRPSGHSTLFVILAKGHGEVKAAAGRHSSSDAAAKDYDLFLPDEHAHPRLRLAFDHPAPDVSVLRVEGHMTVIGGH